MISARLLSVITQVAESRSMNTNKQDDWHGAATTTTWMALLIQPEWGSPVMKSSKLKTSTFLYIHGKRNTKTYVRIAKVILLRDKLRYLYI